jgi:hypothetical protein
MTLIITNSEAAKGFDLTGSAFLIVWSYYELTSGVNYFRRALGAVFLCVTIYSFF